jgi:long-chain acyl-CoA synthetase
MGEPILDLIPAEQARTLYGLFRERVRRSPDKLAYRGYDREAKAWTDSSWADMAALVGRWQAALAKEGLQPGDRVAIALRNCREWVAFDQAALGLGLVTVPLYCDDRADNVAYILNDCTARLVLIENPRLWQRLAPALKDVASVERILLLESDDTPLKATDPRLRQVADWLPAKGELCADKGESRGLASIVYTSGTSGRSKGVMLSHWNMLSIAEASWKVVNVRTTDLFLSFLPLSHTFERTVGYYVALMAGASVAHARSVNQLAEDLVEIRPTVLIAVPRIFERVHTRILQQMAKGPAIKKKLFDLTVQVGWERFEYRQGRRKLPSPLLALWPLLDRLVAKKVMDKLGGRVRASISGGAALPPAISKVFIALGLNLMQGYGLTEFSPVASVNPEHDNDPSTIGPPLPGVEARIGENRELLLRGPGVMMGYWNNPVATRQAIDPDGWLHTGDQAEFVGTHLRIIGRIKEIVVMSNGEKLPPADIEAAITLDPLFEQAMIIGEGKPYLTALLVLNAEQWPEVAAEFGLDPNDPASLNDSALLQKMQARVTHLLRDFPGYAKVRRIALSLEPWSVDNGCLTATMKLKRNAVVQRYAQAIEQMYATAQRA